MKCIVLDRLSINPKKFSTPTLTPTHCPQTSKNSKYERGSQKLENWDFRFRFRLREDATTTLTPTNRPILWCPQFLLDKKILAEMY